VLVFYGCVFFLAQSGFSSAFSAAQEAAMQEHLMILRGIRAEQAMVAARGGASEAADAAIVASYGGYYSRRGAGLGYVSGDGRQLYSSLPGGLVPGDDSPAVLRLKRGEDGSRYFYITAAAGSGVLSYAREAEALFTRQRQQNLLLAGAGAAFSLALTIGLYVTLKRIYRPIDNLAHELRTPLTAIHGYAQYIALAALSEEERLSAAAFIADESRRLEEIVDKLLILSNLREGETDWAEVSMEELFGRAARLYPCIRLSIGWHSVTGDGALLGSLIGNLVDNAVKASPEGTPVELIAEEGRILVLDRGGGLNEALLKRLNDPDSRERASATGGAGLGIPLCHQIARLHRARLTFENREGGGTAARVEFLQCHNNSIAASKHGADMLGKKQGGRSI